MIGLAVAPSRGTDAHRLLVRDLIARLPEAALLSSHATPWASVTFTGARHVVSLDLRDPVAARRFARGIGEVEFALRGHLVADIAATADPGGGLRIEALTVEER